jgi:hypothetical protein
MGIWLGNRMNKKYLVYRLSDGVCVNNIVWDGESPYQTDEGTAIEITPAGSFAGIGWIRDEHGEYHPPVVEGKAE